MFKSIGVDDVRQVADLARQAADAHRRLIGGMHDIDVRDQPSERGSRNPTDIDALNLLDQTTVRKEIDALRNEIQRHDPAARQELKAAMLIGRGDYAAGEWDRAMDAAAAVPDTTDADYLAEKLTLHEYLTKALYELKCL